jgi:tripartite-type tricarboxylate transporter receptor subunit TctC
MPAGHVDIGFAGLPTALPQVQAGALKALGVSCRTPSPEAPKIPAVASTPALANFELNHWFGVFVPAKTPDARVQRTQKNIAEVLQMADVRESLEKQGAEPSGTPTAEFAEFVRSEREKFANIVKAGDISP